MPFLAVRDYEGLYEVNSLGQVRSSMGSLTHPFQGGYLTRCLSYPPSYGSTLWNLG